jgi:hypothetical protein
LPQFKKHKFTMKQFSAFLVVGLVMFASCKKSDDAQDPGTGTIEPPPGSTVDVRGTITTDQTWKKDRTYRLRGYVYVANGATLNIEPGTKIISNKDSAGVLVVYRTSKINAVGTATEPIVFTSGETTPAPGDFGGLIIAGLATGNGNHAVIEGGVKAEFSAFGGTNDADNSGTLKYVRIEYAGKAVNPGDEVNGLSLYGVGSGTTIDYVQVVRGLDDAFEIFGGTVNLKHLVAFRNADDDFDFDDGYRGKIQYALSIKDPAFTDPKGTSGDVSNNFEVDNVNPANGFLLTKTPITSPVLSNFTTVGPNGVPGTSADYGWAMRWRRGAKFVLANSIVIGAQKGLRIQEDSTIYYYTKGTSAFYNNFLHSVASTVDVQTGLTLKDGTYDNASITALTTGTYKSTIVTNLADLKLTDAFSPTAPNFKLGTGSPALSGALFDFGTLPDTFFDKVSFRGAFDGTADWTTGWTVWNK